MIEKDADTQTLTQASFLVFCFVLAAAFPEYSTSGRNSQRKVTGILGAHAIPL